jgi:PAS domain S-box-containing protein
MSNEDLDKYFSAEDFYRTLFSNPLKNCVLLLDVSGIVREVNRAFLLSFGYDAADLIGQHFSMLFTEQDKAKDLPMREIRSVLDEGQSFDNNYLVNKNNVRTWVSGESVLLSNGKGQQYILKIIQNIHTQKESEYSIISLNTFNESILSTIDDGVLVLDKALKIAKANRSFYRLFDLSEDSSGDITLTDLFTKVDKKQELSLAIARIQSDRSCDPPFQLDFENARGIARSFEVSCARFESQPQSYNLLIVFHDITAQKNQDRQREDILNFVAHELRNPLTNIILNIGWLKSLMSEEGPAGHSEFLERAARNAERLKKLVNELYRSTKLIAGNHDLQITTNDLNECIAECIDAVKREHEDFRIDFNAGTDVKVPADRDRLMQVLNNYLSNAVKYSGDNKHISVVTATYGDYVSVAVTDRGKGISVKELPFVFNRFYRAEKTRSLEGLGLGLFFCRQVIEAHHGRTWVESAEGKGSTFYFSLPIAK